MVALLHSQAAPVVVVARVYYPVPLPGGVLIHCAYESEQESGVEVYCEGGRPVLLGRLRVAAAYCDELNAQQQAFPSSLPLSAMRFLLRRSKQGRVIEKQGRCYLLVPMGRTIS